MSSLQNGLWRAAQNTKIPGPSLVFSYRVSGLTAPVVGTAAQLVQIPATASNPAQYTQTQAPNNFAVTSSPTLPSNEPQQGLRLLVTQMIVRDANGVLFGTSATTNTSISLIDQNYNSSGAWTSSQATGFTPNAAAAANTVLTVQGAAATAISAAPAGGSAPYVTAQIGVANGTTGGSTNDQTGLVVINPYDQLAINIVAGTGTAGATPPTATGFTVDVIGLWVPAI